MFLVYYNSFIIMCAVMLDRECFMNKLNLWLFITSASWNFSANKLVPQPNLLGLGFPCTHSYKHTTCVHERERERDKQSVQCVWPFLSMSNLRAYLTFCSQCSGQTGKTQVKGMKNEKSLKLLHLSPTKGRMEPNVFSFCLLPLTKVSHGFLAAWADRTHETRQI